MNVTYMQHLPVAKCKSSYEMRLSGILPQKMQVENFIIQHKLTDVLFVNGQTFDDPVRTHECIVFIVNDYYFVSLQKLVNLIKQLKLYTKKYFYLVINKFLIYTEQDSLAETMFDDLDQRLIHYLTSAVGLPLVESHWDSNDCGLLGNFAYPITQLVFRVDE
jgi:hypothetical protein